MTDLQKATCYLLLSGFLLVAAVGNQVSGRAHLGELCYLGVYATGLAGALFLVRGFSRRNVDGGEVRAEKE